VFADTRQGQRDAYTYGDRAVEAIKHRKGKRGGQKTIGEFYDDWRVDIQSDVHGRRTEPTVIHQLERVKAFCEKYDEAAFADLERSLSGEWRGLTVIEGGKVAA
jgi:hypothetical protein